MSAVDPTGVFQRDSLTIALEAAVPLWIMHAEAFTEAQRAVTIRRWASEGATEVASHGDILQYGSKKRGEVAAVFNALARGLAALAFCPGGVRFMERMWCARHAKFGRAAQGSQSCAACVDDPPTEGATHDPETVSRIRAVETLLPREDIL